MWLIWSIQDCDHLARYQKMLLILPYISRFLINIMWSTVSKAFNKSMKTPSLFWYFSNNSSLKVICSVEKPIWKPNCLKYRSFSVVRYLWRRLYMIRSKTGKTRDGSIFTDNTKIVKFKKRCCLSSILGDSQADI